MSNRKESVLLTGGSGFLGKIIKAVLESRGYSVKTLGRSTANDICCDLANGVPELTETYNWVIHNAGKAHVVPKNKAEAAAFYHVNVKGTEHLLKGLSNGKDIPRGIVFISSVSVYGCCAGENINEHHPLTAKDPYGSSKIEAERLISSWGREHHVISAILRLPLLAGQGAPGNLGAMVNAMRKGFYMRIGKGTARKSMVMAEDVAHIIPTAVERGGVYNLTDGYHPSFAELEDHIRSQVNARKPLTIPYPVARLMGITGSVLDWLLPGKAPITSEKIEKIISTLTFDDQKARLSLGWKPRSVIDAFII